VVSLKLTDVSEVRTAPIIIAMMMEAVRTSETSDDFNVTTRRYIPEDSKLHTRRRENLKSHLSHRLKCIPFFSCSFLKIFSAPNSEEHVGLNVNCVFLVRIFNKIGTYLQILIKLPNRKFNKNPPSLSLVVIRGRIFRKTWRS
jgi:hypothetical protein